jgi:four helix bundle protein
MAFDAYDRSLDLIRALAPLLPRLVAADKGLEDQLRRSARSVLLNIAEANRRKGADRANRFRWALAEAAEVSAALEAAIAGGSLDALDAVEALALADRVRAMTYRLASKG